jgi:hypothetical protein
MHLLTKQPRGKNSGLTTKGGVEGGLAGVEGGLTMHMLLGNGGKLCASLSI